MTATTLEHSNSTQGIKPSLEDTTIDDEDDEEENEEPEEIEIRIDPLAEADASIEDAASGLKLIQMCRSGDLLAVEDLVKAGAPAGFISNSDWTPVAAAAFAGHLPIVNFLMEIGADSMYKSAASQDELQESTSDKNEEHRLHFTNSGINTPLHWACYKGHSNIALALLHAGYSPEDVDPVGNRCLHLAVSGGHLNIVELLLANSVVTNERNNYGNLPVDLSTDPTCTNILLKFETQTHCEWCLESFGPLKRPSLCQNCRNIFCNSTPCSITAQEATTSGSRSFSSRGDETGNTQPVEGRVRRYCQECADETNKAEQNLSFQVHSRLALIQNSMAKLPWYREEDAVLQKTIIEAPSTATLHVEEEKVEPSNEITTGSEEVEADATTKDQSDEPSNGGEEAEQPQADVDNDGDAAKPTAVGDQEQSTVEEMEPGADIKTKDDPHNQVLSSDQVLEALTLKHADAESLFTAMEAAQNKAVGHSVVNQAKEVYQLLLSQIALEEEIKSLMAVRPIGIRSQVAPLMKALRRAKQERVNPATLKLAAQVVKSAEAECALFGSYEQCAKIETGSKHHLSTLDRLDAAVKVALKAGCTVSLADKATALLHKLKAEVALEASLLPFTESSSGSSTIYRFEDGTEALSLLAALETRADKLTSAIEAGSQLEGVSAEMLEEGANILKQLKKEIREETKNEEERRRLEEEAALKAARKGKKKK